MGKSPGKWFKAVLFGKKSSKSNLSKGKEITKSANEKTTPVPNKEPVASLPVDPPLISEPLPCPTAKIQSDSEEVDNARLPSVGSILASPKQNEEVQSATDPSPTEDSDGVRLEQTAIKAQAVVRGFLGRREFKTLQVITRMQAIIRGHLVRRQAVATLYSVQGIVKFQALFRGHLVRGSDIGIEVRSKSNLEKQVDKHAESCQISSTDRAQKLLKNAFVDKLLSVSPTVMLLHLQYGREEPNSAWNWLLRWTVSHVSKPKSEPMKDVSLKHQRVEKKKARAKSSGRRMQSSSAEVGTNHSTSDLERAKSKSRRVPDNSANSTQRHPQNEIENVKHSLKKVSHSIKVTSVQIEVDAEQHRQNHRKSQNLSAPELSDNRTETRSDKLRVETEQAVAKSTDRETIAELSATDCPVNELHDHPAISNSEQLEDDRTGNDENKDILTLDQSGNDKQVKDDQAGTESHKINKRTALPAKHDDLETVTGLPSVTKVPSYMAATESAKAKVRGQISPRFGQEGHEKNSLTRRHSLPSSAGAKLSSSPRVQRLLQASGRGGIRIDRSLSSSRDDKSVQEWRR